MYLYVYVDSRATAVYFYWIGRNKREDDDVDEGIEGEKTLESLRTLQ